ncbi:TIGR02391 family protein [Subtercola endophyticus]|uniref:TIGR02391 family protein n=1 Tax=Subtercola endophyticus TaxID=2895559 RepID=UPI001E5AF63E|nr:TIGR02391 family protein [Subtercola endophyticus]UFS57590.1 TIGR02391 family protein [Subtercola endophyticus]
MSNTPGDDEAPLVLRFDPQTVEHLGAKMYSQLPNAIAELVANAYDADATNVTVAIGHDGSVSVIDDGHGMSREDLAQKYLRIGRNRRHDEASSMTSSGRRRVSGKKGLGKLALFGIGKIVRLDTSREASIASSHVSLSYDEMMSADGEYKPSEFVSEIESKYHGTTVTLRDLKRKSPIDAAQLAVSLSRLFNYTDVDFSLSVVGPDEARHEVTQALRLNAAAVEFAWVFPEDFIATNDYLASRNVTGRIVSAMKPLGQDHRGVTLYAHGRLVNEPEFFGASESSFAFEYLSGYLEVDFLDELSYDVIATDRRALDWDLDETAQLRAALQQLITRVGQERRERRRSASKSATESTLGTSTEDWVASVKSPEKQQLQTLVESIISDDLNIDTEQQVQLLEDVRQLAPEGAEYAWRHFHPEVQASTRTYYDAGDYWAAVQESIKRYVALTAAKSGATPDEALKVITAAFGESGTLKVLDRLRQTSAFSETTIKNLQSGQKHLSMGVLAGFRNPMAHEELAALKANDVFTYQDCLDALGILSHLTRRLDESEL